LYPLNFFTHSRLHFVDREPKVISIAAEMEQQEVSLRTQFLFLLPNIFGCQPAMYEDETRRK
jgi:hypothetical protein